MLALFAAAAAVVALLLVELSSDETVKSDFGIVAADILRRVCVCVCMCICCSVALFCALLPPNNYSGGVGELLTRMFTLSLALFLSRFFFSHSHWSSRFVVRSLARSLFFLLLSSD